MSEIKKTNCLVIEWLDGEDPKIIINGTDEDLKNGAKLYCNFDDAIKKIRSLEESNEYCVSEMNRVRDLLTPHINEKILLRNKIAVLEAKLDALNAAEELRGEK